MPHAAFALVVCCSVVACRPSPEPTLAVATSDSHELPVYAVPDATCAPATEVELRDAIRAGQVRVDARGAGMSAVELVLHARADVSVVVESGTLFDTSPNASYQRMVSLRETRVNVCAGARVKARIETACADHSRGVPGSSDRFTVGAAPEELAVLVKCLEGRRISHGTSQIAIWTVTDDVTPERLSQRPEMMRPLLLEKCLEKFPGRGDRCERWVDAGLAVAGDALFDGVPEIVRECREARD